jgi:hypothetical protein
MEGGGSGGAALALPPLVVCRDSLVLIEKAQQAVLRGQAVEGCLAELGRRVEASSDTVERAALRIASAFAESCVQKREGSGGRAGRGENRGGARAGRRTWNWRAPRSEA